MVLPMYSYFLVLNVKGNAVKRRNVSSRKRRYISDIDLTDTSDDENFDFSSLPKRRSRRQRGLDPELTEMYSDSYVCFIESI